MSSWLGCHEHLPTFASTTVDTLEREASTATDEICNDATSTKFLEVDVPEIDPDGASPWQYLADELPGLVSGNSPEREVQNQ